MRNAVGGWSVIDDAAVAALDDRVLGPQHEGLAPAGVLLAPQEKTTMPMRRNPASSISFTRSSR